MRVPPIQACLVATPLSLQSAHTGCRWIALEKPEKYLLLVLTGRQVKFLGNIC